MRGFPHLAACKRRFRYNLLGRCVMAVTSLALDLHARGEPGVLIVGGFDDSAAYSLHCWIGTPTCVLDPVFSPNLLPVFIGSRIWEVGTVALDDVERIARTTGFTDWLLRGRKWPDGFTDSLLDASGLPWYVEGNDLRYSDPDMDDYLR